MKVRWLRGDEVVKLCQVSLNEILNATMNGLVPYDSYGIEWSIDWNKIEVNCKNKERIFKIIQNSMYKSEDVESHFKAINLQNIFSGQDEVRDIDGVAEAKDKQELGRLRLEKEKWPYKFKAGVLGGFVAGMNQGQVTKQMIRDGWDKLGMRLADIPDRLVDEVWDALPIDKKKGPGRPRKDAD